MITPSYVRTMAAYNAEMNRRLYAAAARIPDADRRAERGAFWGSLHGTLTHLVWADHMWMSRFDGWERPPVPIRQSAGMIADFAALAEERSRTDARLEDWAGRIDQTWLDQDLVWFSGAAQREMRAPRVFLVAHVFNHQTHHRGQAHALITACGEATDDTDLMLVIDGPR
ncbi:MAG: DinB family protein [Acetobacteraceae bacterium]